MSELRQLHLRGALGAVRTEMWDGREHLVVPVVALQESAIHAVNAKNREFVSAAALTNSVGRWNGHPLVVGHPKKDGRQISAHDPSVLERHGFGFIRQAAMNGKRLGMEAMVDPARLVALKQDALLADLRAGKNIEVSVGAFVTTNDKKGSHGGRAYDGEWTEINPDHLAFLPGGTGACSVADGCGAHRVAEAYLVTAEGFEALSNPEGINQYSHGASAASEKADKSGTAHDHLEASRAHGKAVIEQRGHGHRAGGRKSDEGKKHFAKAEEHLNAQDKHFAKYKELHPVKGLSMNITDIKSRILALFDAPEGADIEAVLDDFRTAVGKRNNATDQAMIQTVHDHATQLGATCDYANARFAIDGSLLAPHGPLSTLQSGDRVEVREKELFITGLDGKTRSIDIKLLTTKECTTCHGTGQVKEDGKQTDCPACDGDGTLKTAACGCHTQEADMTKDERVAALLKNEHNPLKDQKALTAADDASLTALEAHCANAATLKAAADKQAADAKAIADKAAADLKAAEDKAKSVEERLTTAEATLKVAQAAQIPAEELAELRALGAEKKAADAAEHAGIVAQLKTAQTAFTEDELKAKPLPELRKLALMARVEPAKDYSGRGVAVPRAAAAAGDFTPPNVYPSLAPKAN